MPLSGHASTHEALHDTAVPDTDGQSRTTVQPKVRTTDRHIQTYTRNSAARTRVTVGHSTPSDASFTHRHHTLASHISITRVEIYLKLEQTHIVPFCQSDGR